LDERQAICRFLPQTVSSLLEGLCTVTKEDLALAATARAPVVAALVNHSRCIDRLIQGEGNLESGRLSVEFLRRQHTLSVHGVGAGQRLHLPLLEAAIGVVETFGSRASRGSQISIVLELPVGPANEVLVSNVANLSDLLGAGALSQTSAELSHVEWDAEALGVLRARPNALLVPGEALVGEGGVRLA